MDSKLFSDIIGIITTNAPILINLVKGAVDTAHQNKEMTDEEHAAFVAMIIKRAQTDPAWAPSPDYKP